MMEDYYKYIGRLNDADKIARLLALKPLAEAVKKGELKREQGQGDVNNHIHTIYSFSPYSPSKAAFFGCMAGLDTVGIMDHDSVGGTKEFLAACDMLGVGATIGAECRVSMANTPLTGRKINNPDQASVAYCALHGIPHQEIDNVAAFFKPYTEKRNERNKKMIGKLNETFAGNGIVIDFDKDVVPLSMYHDGGSITERHILYAVSQKIVEKFGKGEKTVEFLTGNLGLNVSEKIRGYLLDEFNPGYEYDVLGVLKSDTSSFYIDADEELPDVTEYIALAKKTGAIAAYAYLGDIGDSVTGDKRAQKFEDGYIEELFTVLKELGFDAITYMPSRNTKEQLRRVRSLCDEYGFFQISGEDINSPRQSFICTAQRDPEYNNLRDAAWALIGHEKAASVDKEFGFFSPKIIEKFPTLGERTAYFSNLAKKCR